MGKLDYFKYKLNFKEPVPVINTSISGRNGVYIIIKKNTYSYGIGEIAPLPGLSKDKIEEIIPILKTLSQQEIEFNKEFINKLYTKYINYPSLLFGLESAFLMINKSVKSTSIKTHFFSTSLHNINSKKIQLLKYKIGLQNLDKDLKLIQNTIAINPKIKFRFDVNNRLHLQDSCDFFNKINKKNIDYVEDPCDENDLEKFYKITNIKYAIDCPKNTKTPPSSLKGLTALIIKPTIIGPVKTILKLKNEYKVNKIILSSCYESKIGLNGLANYAQLLSPNEIHGINTEHFFKYATAPNSFNKFHPTSIKNLKTWILKQC
jgi:o-succinylbenzoate synthase